MSIFAYGSERHGVAHKTSLLQFTAQGEFPRGCCKSHCIRLIILSMRYAYLHRIKVR